MSVTNHEIEIQKIKNHIEVVNPKSLNDLFSDFLKLYSKHSVSLDNYVSVITEMKNTVEINDVVYSLEQIDLKLILDQKLLQNSPNEYSIGEAARKQQVEIENKRKAESERIEKLFREREKREARLREEETKRKARLKEEETKRKEREFIETVNIKYNEISKTNDNKLITQFVKKFDNNASENEIEMLKDILNQSKWKISLRELKFFISKEINLQDLKRIKSRILVSKPITKNEILKSYLDFYETNDNRALKVLSEILKERDVEFLNISILEKELIEIERQIELENFKKKLLETNEPKITIEDIDLLDGYEFEGFLKDLYQKMGYEVKPTRLSGDQGADLVVVKFGEKTVIQAKCYSGKVGNKAVQEILASISLYKAQKGTVITNNYYTSAAFELAEANNIELIDREDLEKLINTYW